MHLWDIKMREFEEAIKSEHQRQQVETLFGRDTLKPSANKPRSLWCGKVNTHAPCCALPHASRNGRPGVATPFVG